MSISGLTSDWKMLMIPGGPEESKVKLWHRVSLLSDVKKRGASRVAHFLHSVFKEQATPQSGEGSLLRWFWSFTGVSRAVVGRTGAAIVVCATASLVVHWLQHLLRQRQIESSCRAKTFALTPHAVSCYRVLAAPPPPSFLPPSPAA